MKRVRSKPKKRVSRNLQARVTRVENLIRKTVEKKHIDHIATSSATGDAIDNLNPLELIAQFRIPNTDAGEEGRVGNTVNLLSQRFMMNLVKGGAGDKIVRILVVNNPNYESSTALNIDDVLQYGSWTTDGFHTFSSPYRMEVDASKRYQVMYDKVFSLTDEKPYVKIDFKKNFGTKKSPGKVCRWEFDTSDYPNNHRVCVFALTDHTSQTNAPRLTVLTRNKYIDA